MKQVWDYDPKKLKKTKSGKILLLERTINYGPSRGQKISLSEVKKHWDELNLFPQRKKLMKLLIWGKTQS